MSNPVIIFSQIRNKTPVINVDVEYILEITNETDRFWREIKGRIIEHAPRSVYKYINLKKLFGRSVTHKDWDIYMWLAHGTKALLLQKRYFKAIPEDIREDVLKGRIL